MISVIDIFGFQNNMAQHQAADVPRKYLLNRFCGVY